jgi:hypothetical protein
MQSSAAGSTSRWSAPAENQRDHKQDQEQEKEDLCDPGRVSGEAAESKNCGDDGNNQENQSPAQHVSPRFELGSVER